MRIKRKINVSALCFWLALSTASAQEKWDLSRHGQDTVIAGLWEHVSQRLRFGFYEESLAACLDTAEAYDGKLADYDQARLDEVLGRCQMVNGIGFGKAAERFARADRLLSKSGRHGDADDKYRSIDDGMASRLRLPLWQAECLLIAGEDAKSSALLQKLVPDAAAGFGGGFEASLDRYVREKRKAFLDDPDYAMIHAFDARVKAWSKAATLLMRADGNPRVLFGVAGNAGAVEALVRSDYFELGYQAAIESDHFVGPHPLGCSLDLGIRLLEFRGPDHRDTLALAGKMLRALEDDGLNLFAPQRARLLALVAAHGKGDARDKAKRAMLELLSRPAELGTETLYSVALGGAVASGDPAFVGDVVLVGKMRSTRYFAERREALRKTGKAKFASFQDAFQDWIGSRMRRGAMHPSTVEHWDNVVEQLAEGGFGETASGGGRAALASRLGRDSAAIEWVRHGVWAADDEGADYRERGQAYLAVVFDARGRAETIRLGDAAETERLCVDLAATIDRIDPRKKDRLAVLSKDILDGVRRIHARIVAPVIAGSAAAQDARRWIVGLDGSLSLVPFFALPDADGGMLGMKKDLVHVNHVGGWNGHGEGGGGPVSALLMGNPDYGAADAISPSAGTSRSVVSGLSGVISGFGPLPGTATEVQALSAAASRTGRQARTVMGKEASEKTLRQALPSSNVVHVATHGFFLPIDMQAEAVGDGTPESLFYSAIVLSGANVALDRFSSGRLPASENDGLLLAAELFPLDLRHVRLVSLSACETALGEPRPGEGVAGLSQGLSVAGAQNTVLSLWKIHDRATAEVMADFFAKITEGQSPQEAMRATQRAMYSKFEAEFGEAMAIWFAAGFRVTGNTLYPAAPGVPAPTVRPAAPPSAPAVDTDLDSLGSKWVIACEARTERAEAEACARRWRQRGVPSGVLWIPDYASLSGAKYWLTYVGPWRYGRDEAEVRRILSSKVLPHYSEAYGIRVDQKAKRETLK